MTFRTKPVKLCHFILFALFAVTPTAGCVSRGFVSKGKPTSQLPDSEIKSPNIGLYALDGSLNICPVPKDNVNDKTVICQLYEEASAAIAKQQNNELGPEIKGKFKVAKYFKGVTKFRTAGDLPEIDAKALKAICDDIKIHELGKILMIGYSRGAISAIIVAEDVFKTCDFEAMAKPEQWLGLIDAVESSVWLEGKELEEIIKGVRFIPAGVSALHIHKEPKSGPEGEFFLYTTTDLAEENSGAKLEEISIPGISHEMIGRFDRTNSNSKDFTLEKASEAYRILRKAAQLQGALFE